MASPSVNAVVGLTSDQTTGLTADIALPASGITAGDTICILIGSKAATGSATIPGYTRFLDVAQTLGSQASLHGFWKVADGTENGTTVTVTFTAESRAAAVAFTVEGAADPTVTPPEVTTAVFQNTFNPDPPSLTPTGGSKDYLWIAAFSQSGGRITSSDPTGYTHFSAESGPNNGTVTNIGIGVAGKQSTAASENPGTFTTTGAGTEESAACTIAFHPGVASQTVTVGFINQAGQVFSPTVQPQAVTVSVGFINQAPQIFAPTISQVTNVTAGFIDQAPQIFSPTILPGSVTVTVPFINQSGQVFTPQANQTVAVGFIDQAGQVFAPAAIPGSVTVTVPFINQAGQVFAPTVTPQPLTVTVPFINQAGQVFAPTISQITNVTVPFINQAAVIYAPVIANVTRALVKASASLLQEAYGYFAFPNIVSGDAEARQVAVADVTQPNVVQGGAEARSKVVTEATTLPA